MKISSDFNPYATGLSSGEYQRRVAGQQDLVRSKELEKVITDTEESRVAQSEDLLSKPEKEFFIKMFPESKSQIENHTLFNSKGRVRNVALGKGQIVDARV